MTTRRVLPRPTSDDPQRLGFTRKAPTRHQSPLAVVRAIADRLGKAVAGVEQERRDLAAQTLPEYAHPELSYAEHGELWVDLVADTGDGFNPTYAVARALTEPVLRIDGADTRRGALLVLGGDLVYPVPGRRAYRDRMVGPFTAAAPVEDAVSAPDVVALPGTHDWIDGLAAFRTTFVQGGWFGSWRLRQTRSYLAAELPHGYWLWGIDTSLGVDVEPQRKYFVDAASKLGAGDRVIVVGYHPLWQQIELDHLGQLQTLVDLVDHRGAELLLQVSGKRHYYARYDTGPPAAPRTYAIVNGGGGAFTEDSTGAPERVAVPLREPVAATCAVTFPSAQASRALTRRSLWRVPFRALGLGVLLSLAWCLAVFRALGEPGAPELHRAVGPFVAAGAALWLSVLFAEQGKPRRTAGTWILGGVHAGTQVAVAWLLTLAVARAYAGPERYAVLFGVLAVAEPAVLALYLAVARLLFGQHRAEILPTLGVQDYKSFVRLHVAADATLTIYPIGIEDVPRNWRFEPGGRPEDPWFTTDQPIGALVASIHPPIVVPPNAAQRAALASPVAVDRDPPHDLFVSYARADRDWVRGFLDAFEARAEAAGIADVRVFVDTDSLRQRDYWRTRILDELDRCHCIAVVWSPAYVAAWQKRKMCFVEHDHAKRREMKGEPDVVFELLARECEIPSASGGQQASRLDGIAPETLGDAAAFQRIADAMIARIRVRRGPGAGG
jgi:hypothetical protein